MKPIIIHVEAEVELWNAVDYYESKKRGLGLDLEKEVRHALAEIQSAPDRWPKQKFNTRLKLLSRFPFAIHYLELLDSIWIAAYAHTRRRPYYWRDRIQ